MSAAPRHIPSAGGLVLVFEIHSPMALAGVLAEPGSLWTIPAGHPCRPWVMGRTRSWDGPTLASSSRTAGDHYYVHTQLSPPGGCPRPPPPFCSAVLARCLPLLARRRRLATDSYALARHLLQPSRGTRLEPMCERVSMPACEKVFTSSSSPPTMPAMFDAVSLPACENDMTPWCECVAVPV